MRNDRCRIFSIILSYSFLSSTWIKVVILSTIVGSVTYFLFWMFLVVLYFAVVEVFYFCKFGRILSADTRIWFVFCIHLSWCSYVFIMHLFDHISRLKLITSTLWYEFTSNWNGSNSAFTAAKILLFKKILLLKSLTTWISINIQRDNRIHNLWTNTNP